MNIHSREERLNATFAIDADEDRHNRIFAAAERAFVRHGFHGASMQAIAAEARMSAGNLYRYFASKEAIVSGLVRRDQANMAEDFRAMAAAPDIFAVIERILRVHLIEAPVERHRLIITIWAEMARNPVIRESCGGVDTDMRHHLRSVVERARQSGMAASSVDPDYVVRLMATIVSGLFKRRATEPTFDGEAELSLALGVFRAAFDGVLQPYRATMTMGPTS